ncbi:hypothetical protein BDY17DRAFT_290885 [Neohortaea acidophila]|uniref:ubiquitinyl hydrolase 1 n=1 Tax=Neohortaea acidophila TaxID=245834 RepID=A0A6A6Q1H5_9PEZI|nr:uncharacterized protein BDY17DRAFT_290885 [Neohortaea acidophila]KAF2486132.1 hypothetical protein BDY17DRAFT_290885 [Neohortaea acidophila]
MERSAAQLEYLGSASLQPPSLTTSLLYASAFLYILSLYFKYPVAAPHLFIWDAVVYIIPQRLLLHRAQRQELATTGMLAQTHAAKKEALSGMLGMSGASLLSKLPAGASEGVGIMRRASTSLFSRPQLDSDAPAGLGNWDTSCYQNSVLQGLASLHSLNAYLKSLSSDEESTSASLLATVNNLNDPANNGRQLWTPAKLKNMSSWQQQDAQEYYSKILDSIDKEAIKAFASSRASAAKAGLETLAEDDAEATTQKDSKDTVKAGKSPLDGLFAQKVTCTRCGYSEGLSMIPFNCLTLPLPVGSNTTTIQDCLDEYTKLEEITDVECTKCTLLHAQDQLKKMLPADPGYQCTDAEAKPSADSRVLQLPPELRAQAFKRLAAVQKALEEDDFTDQTLSGACQIGKKARVSSTKTRQAVVARSPQCLVVHVNRSVFDETTFVQRKNYARVEYPRFLDLAPWMLDEDGMAEEEQAVEGMHFRLKAVVTHYGRHENGHYIAYRQHPVRRKGGDSDDGEESVDLEDALPTTKSDPWYRLSDEDVSPVEEADALSQGGVFMLFYEREHVSEVPSPEDVTTEPADVQTAEAAGLEPELLTTTTSGPVEELDGLDAADLPMDTVSTPDDDLPDTSVSIPPSEPKTSEDGRPPQEEITDSDELRTTSSGGLVRMRTARIPVMENEFAGNAFRAVAAT